jgi:RHS repeat-associated protein
MDQATQQVLDTITYTGFGVLATESNAAVGGRLKYTGKELDSDTGYQNNTGRWYDPATGRWVNEDPSRFQGGDATLTRYVGNDPTNYTDPTGLKRAQAPPLQFEFGQRRSILGTDGAAPQPTVGSQKSWTKGQIWDPTDQGLKGVAAYAKRAGLDDTTELILENVYKIRPDVYDWVVNYNVGIQRRNTAWNPFRKNATSDTINGRDVILLDDRFDEVKAAEELIKVVEYKGLGGLGLSFTTDQIFAGLRDPNDFYKGFAQVMALTGHLGGELVLAFYQLALGYQGGAWAVDFAFSYEFFRNIKDHWDPKNPLFWLQAAGSTLPWLKLLKIVPLAKNGIVKLKLELQELNGVKVAPATVELTTDELRMMLKTGKKPASLIKAEEELKSSLKSLTILGSYCFVAGTPLLTPEGSKPIERFRVGELILSRSEHDAEGPIEAKVVEEVFVRTAPIVSLLVGGREIRTTAEHPFYVQNKGWMCAKELVPNEQLLSHDGQWVAVESVTDSGEVTTVYNLRVSEYHTYFVGCEEWGFSVWAHNAACSETVRLALEAKGISIPKGDPRLATIAEHINGGNLGAARKAIQDLPGGKDLKGKQITDILDASANPPVQGAPASSTPTPPQLSPAGRVLDDEIANHSQGHWPGESVQRIRQRVDEVITGFHETHTLSNGQSIFRRGDTVVIVNGPRVEGTIFRPTNTAGESSIDIAKAYVQRWLKGQ